MLSRVDSEQVALLSVKNSFVFIPKFLFFLKDLLLQENEIAKEKKTFVFTGDYVCMVCGWV